MPSVLQLLAASLLDDQLRESFPKLPKPISATFGEDLGLSWRGEDIWVTADVDPSGDAYLFARNDILHRYGGGSWAIDNDLPDEITYVIDPGS